MLSASIQTPWREGLVGLAPKSPAAHIHGGAIVCSDAAGLAVPGRSEPGLAFLGVAEEAAAPGGASVLLRRNVDFLLRSDPANPVAAANIGRPCWIVDDEFVAASDGGGTRPAAGVVRPGTSGTRARGLSCAASRTMPAIRDGLGVTYVTLTLRCHPCLPSRQWP